MTMQASHRGTIASSDSRLLASIDGAVMVVEINRPEKRNALDAGMVQALGSLCAWIERDDAIRAVLLIGAGNRSFCAGGDIEAWSDLPPEEFGRFWIREGNEVFDRLARLRQPVIAVLNGDALGGGFELAACADYRIGEAHARIGQPESGIGIIPGWSGTQRAVRRFGSSVVRRMALFGEMFDSREALRLGLIDVIVDSGEGRSAGLALARTLQARGARATELTKMLVNVAEGEESSRIVEALAGSLAADSEELRQGIDRFRAKRRTD